MGARGGAKNEKPPAKGRREGNRRARLSSPFPYAGMTQFRFGGCALRLADSPPTTPNDAFAVTRTGGACGRQGGSASEPSRRIWPSMNSDLQQFVRESLARGIPRDQIRDQLARAAW